METCELKNIFVCFIIIYQGVRMSTDINLYLKRLVDDDISRYSIQHVSECLVESSLGLRKMSDAWNSDAVGLSYTGWALHQNSPFRLHLNGNSGGDG